MTYNVFDVTLKLTVLIYLAMFRRRMVYVVATRNQRDVEQHQREDLLRGWSTWWLPETNATWSSTREKTCSEDDLRGGYQKPTRRGAAPERRLAPIGKKMSTTNAHEDYSLRPVSCNTRL